VIHRSRNRRLVCPHPLDPVWPEALLRLEVHTPAPAIRTPCRSSGSPASRS